MPWSAVQCLVPRFVKFGLVLWGVYPSPRYPATMVSVACQRVRSRVGVR